MLYKYAGQGLDCLAGFESFYYFVTIPNVDSQNVPSLGQTFSWGLATLILRVNQPPNVDLINVQINYNKLKIKCFNLTVLLCCSHSCALTHYLYQTQTINSCIYISLEFSERPHLNNFKRLLGAKEMENHMFIHRLDYTDYYQALNSPATSLPSVTIFITYIYYYYFLIW